MRIGQLAPPLTEQAEEIERVWNGVLIAAIVIGVGVIAFIAFVVVRFRRRGTDLPPQVRENIPIEIAYTLVPLAIVIGLFAVTYVTVDASDVGADEPDLVVEVTGFQWQWQFAYPASGVEVSGTDTVIPELVLPAGAEVRFDLRSVDVLHSFWIPGFRFKRDLFPGQVQSFEVDVADRTGAYPDQGICAEFCGLDHTSMRFSVAVLSPGDFEQWLADRRPEP